MPDLTGVSDFRLKIVFLVHFVFISLSTIGGWVPSAYLFYNFLFVLLLLWGLHNKQSEDPIQLAFAVNGSAIILDVFVLVLCFPYSYQARERFSAAIAILHLIVRPFSTIYLVSVLRERTGNPNLLSNIIPPVHHSSSYEDIDRPVAAGSHQQASAPAGYDFSSAQQI